MNETPRDRENSPRRHETTDANIHNIWVFGVGLFLTVVLSLAGAHALFNYFVARQELGPPASPFENTRGLPPASVPHLQVAAPREMERFRKTEAETLDSYGWVDEKNGIVRIPIGRAMDLLIQRGLPVETQPSGQSELQPDSVQQYTVPKGFTPAR